MKVRLPLVTLFLLIVFNDTVSFAVPATGLDLRDACRATNLDPSSVNKLEEMRMFRCIGYVDGVTDGWLLAGRSICAPADATVGEYAAVVTKYLEDHPEELHLSPASLVIRAVNHAWPCK
jgi:Rap1a immunity proteins